MTSYIRSCSHTLSFLLLVVVAPWKQKKISCFLFRCWIDATLPLCLSMSLAPHVLSSLFSPLLFLYPLHISHSLFSLSPTVYGHRTSALLNPHTHTHTRTSLCEKLQICAQNCSYMLNIFVRHVTQNMWLPLISWSVLWWRS